MSISNVAKAKLYLASGIVSLMLLAAGYYFININTGLTRSDILSSINNLSPDSIDYYILYPNSNVNLFLKDTLYITDIKEISSVTHELAKMKIFQANHPRANWMINLKIKFKDKELQNFHLEIMQADSSNGTCIWIFKDRPNTEFNLGSYRNDNLSNVLKDIIEN
jgi:hypothetical protein